MNADELLRRALDDLELQIGRGLDEIRAYLLCIENAENYARSEEPVAWGCQNKNGQIGFVTMHPEEYENEKFEPLYLNPPKPMKPMTEEEAIELCPFTREEFKGGFLTGIRFAEKFHQIGGSDEPAR